MAAIGVVGAGAAGAALTFAVESAAPDIDVTVLEKSGGVCGRAATRRRGEVTYDYGANYLKADDERVVDLVTGTLGTDGLVDVTDPVWTFDASGSVSEGREADEHKWTYRSGLTQLAKRLFDRTDATVHRRTRVETLRREGDAWRAVDDSDTAWGPFEALVLTPPAPQTATLLDGADWAAPARGDLAAAAGAVPFRSVFTAVLGYGFELDRPYYALVNVDKAHDVGWVAREECKPGHVPAGESVLVVQANHEWSLERRDRAPAANVAALADRVADLLSTERLGEPAWTDHQDWRYALPEGGVDADPLGAAEAHGLYCAGDWVAGEARLHAALRNGLDTGERVLEAL